MVNTELLERICDRVVRVITPPKRKKLKLWRVKDKVENELEYIKLFMLNVKENIDTDLKMKIYQVVYQLNHEPHDIDNAEDILMAALKCPLFTKNQKDLFLQWKTQRPSELYVQLRESEYLILDALKFRNREVALECVERITVLLDPSLPPFPNISSLFSVCVKVASAYADYVHEENPEIPEVVEMLKLSEAYPYFNQKHQTEIGALIKDITEPNNQTSNLLNELQELARVKIKPCRKTKRVDAANVELFISILKMYRVIYESRNIPSFIRYIYECVQYIMEHKTYYRSTHIKQIIDAVNDERFFISISPKQKDYFISLKFSYVEDENNDINFDTAPDLSLILRSKNVERPSIPRYEEPARGRTMTRNADIISRRERKRQTVIQQNNRNTGTKMNTPLNAQNDDQNRLQNQMSGNGNFNQYPVNAFNSMIPQGNMANMFCLNPFTQFYPGNSMFFDFANMRRQQYEVLEQMNQNLYCQRASGMIEKRDPWEIPSSQLVPSAPMNPMTCNPSDQQIFDNVQNWVNRVDVSDGDEDMKKSSDTSISINGQGLKNLQNRQKNYQNGGYQMTEDDYELRKLESAILEDYAQKETMRAQAKELKKNETFKNDSRRIKQGFNLAFCRRNAKESVEYNARLYENIQRGGISSDRAEKICIAQQRRNVRIVRKEKVEVPFESIMGFGGSDEDSDV
jgi:hypothetical protein